MTPNKENSSEWDFKPVTKYEGDDVDFPIQVKWKVAIPYLILHVTAIYGVYLAFTSAAYETLVLAFIFHHLATLGVTAGAHRLWCHRSYKATTSMKIFLMICHCISFQNSIYQWARDHRGHHKFSETNADLHNSKRGFFFSHIGHHMVKKHPDVLEKGKCIEVADLLADPIVVFQKRNLLKLVFLFLVALPTAIPMYFWGESFSTSFFVGVMMRHCWTLNTTWLINSGAHLWGFRPYDKNINPRDNMLLSLGLGGEGWHNYHHTFPMDYKASEVPYLFNLTTVFIDFCAKFGLAYDLKSVPKEIVERRKQRTGD